MNFTGVASTRIHEVWAEVEPLIEQAVSRSGEMSPTDVLVSLLKADMQLWMAADLVVITQISVHPQKRVAEIVYLAGKNRHQWLQYASVLSDWARANGCSSLDAIGRQGWKKDVEKMGFAVKGIVYSKDLSDGQ